MKQPSTRSLGDLPSIDDLLRLSKALAMLDAILSPEWEYRYYSCNSKWAPGETMASMRNGSGDEYVILFNEHGAAIKGFDHESAMSPWNSDPPVIWPGMYDAMPAEFASFLNDPAFSMEAVTFCLWRRYGDTSWQCGVRDLPEGEDPDGSARLLRLLDGESTTYQEFAVNYHEVEVPITAIKHIYALKPLTDEVVESLNEDLTSADVGDDANEIGYPR